MHKHTTKIALVVIMLLLAACGGSASAPATDAEPTEASSPTEAPAAAGVDQAPEEETGNATSDGGDRMPEDGLRVFAIVPGESKAMYLVDEVFFGGALEKYGIAAGDNDIVGTTEDIEGELQLDLASASIGPSEFRVNMTDVEHRSEPARQLDPRKWSQVQRFPRRRFRSHRSRKRARGYNEGEEVTFQLIGDMTIRDITQPMTFDVTATLDGDTITGTAIATTLMSDFGIDPPNFANTLTVADEFKIQVDFVARNSSGQPVREFRYCSEFAVQLF